MTPALRAATVAIALTPSYCVIAATPASAGTATETGAVAPHAPATAVRAKPYDVDGDGDADAVVGEPREDLGSDMDAGMLHVLYSASGRVTTSDQVIHQDTYGVEGTAESGDSFGAV